MNKLFICLISCLLLLSAPQAIAQSQRDLRINEVLIQNEENFEDDFGRHSAWIEIFNSSYGSVNIGGCYLTNDLSQPKMYPIPKGDVLTKISPRQHVLFWADNHPTDGTFHISFTLNERRFVALFGNDGHTLIDSVTLPADLAVDHTYGRIEDGAGEWTVFEKTSPSTNNKLTELEAAGVLFKTHDPWGIAMTITAMSVVFCALLLLFLFFKYLGKVIQYFRNIKREKATDDKTVVAQKASASPSEVYAAIAYALQRYKTDMANIEKIVLTINKVARVYSPWSSKIYGLKETPVKK